jgi:hypothetical protein
MYLNNWIKDIPFKLDTLRNVPRTVREGAYFTSIDDKSGFDNVLLSEESQTLALFLDTLLNRSSVSLKLYL